MRATCRPAGCAPQRNGTFGSHALCEAAFDDRRQAVLLCITSRHARLHGESVSQESQRVGGRLPLRGDQAGGAHSGGDQDPGPHAELDVASLLRGRAQRPPAGRHSAKQAADRLQRNIALLVPGGNNPAARQRLPCAFPAQGAQGAQQGRLGCPLPSGQETEHFPEGRPDPVHKILGGRPVSVHSS